MSNTLIRTKHAKPQHHLSGQHTKSSFAPTYLLVVAEADLFTLPLALCKPVWTKPKPAGRCPDAARLLAQHHQSVLLEGRPLREFPSRPHTYTGCLHKQRQRDFSQNTHFVRSNAECDESSAAALGSITCMEFYNTWVLNNMQFQVTSAAGLQNSIAGGWRYLSLQCFLVAST